MREAVSMKAFLVLSFVLMTLVPVACRAESESPAATERVVIVKQDGGREAFDVEMAVTPDVQVRGLMARESLPERGGMLFVFDMIGPRSFWMKDTLIPLDMLFVEGDGRIAKIHENAVPHDLTSILSGVPVLAVLEINGGTASKLGLAEGDVVHHTAFGNALAE